MCHKDKTKGYCDATERKFSTVINKFKDLCENIKFNIKDWEVHIDKNSINVEHIEDLKEDIDTIVKYKWERNKK